MKTKQSGLKLGDLVVMVNCREAIDYPGVVWECVSDVWDCCGSEVIKLKGKSGGFSTACLQKAQ